MDTKVLKKYEISSSLMRLIDDANDYVVLITPYLKLWGHLTQVITTAIGRGIPVSIIVRDDYSDEKKSVGYDLDNTLEELEKLKVDHFVVPNLHSKLYISEKEAIMTSMNLYEHSAKENEEIGIHTTNSELLKEIESYLEDLSKRTLSYQPGMIRKLLNKLDDIRYGPSDQGACIRCNNELKHNLKKPMCKKCFSEWLRTKEYDKSEPYCHKCSKEESTTIKMPVCKDCKNDFESQFNDDISKYTFGLY